MRGGVISSIPNAVVTLWEMRGPCPLKESIFLILQKSREALDRGICFLTQVLFRALEK